MLLARRRASRSSGEPGRTWAATSAMWTQTRARSPSRWAETASSKSRALAGSTVKVASAVRSRRAPGSRLGPLRRPRRLDLEPGLEAAEAEPLAQQQLDRVAGARRLAAPAAAAAVRAAAAPPGGPAPPARLTPSAQAPA